MLSSLLLNLVLCSDLVPGTSAGVSLGAWGSSKGLLRELLATANFGGAAYFPGNTWPHVRASYTCGTTTHSRTPGSNNPSPPHLKQPRSTTTLTSSHFMGDHLRALFSECTTVQCSSRSFEVRELLATSSDTLLSISLWWSSCR
ncbi:hypothetical protein DPMN_179037 [Dreissena polymorpha]|uniref:Secreted protein n=1 Tax=Dreissena polymorpha TaxID=45954 RepID=A0A9D4ILR9_DREPO|nr:hypothetical protein DPMN_179037 [Dreissena polymorpha]